MKEIARRVTCGALKVNFARRSIATVCLTDVTKSIALRTSVGKVGERSRFSPIDLRIVRVYLVDLRCYAYTSMSRPLEAAGAAE
jgi:hypothetical protein